MTGGGVIGVDLGTSNSLVYVRGCGVVLEEPSVVAVHASTGAVLAVGHHAKQMLGRAPGNIAVVRPLRDGVIADLQAAEAMLRRFLRIATRRRLVGPRVAVCVPGDVTDVERRAVEEATRQAGARAVSIIDDPMAAAIGAGLPVAEAYASMIIDIGGGTTEVAVIALGGIVTRTSVRVGGDDLDAAIIAYLKKHQSLLIGDRTAEGLKLSVGAALPCAREPTAQVRGRDLVSGLPAMVTVTRAEVRAAIEEPLQAIIDAITNTLDRTPPELAADLVARGLTLTGGGALLTGLDRRLHEQTGMPVRVVEVPLTSVAIGAGQCLEHFNDLEEAPTPSMSH